jgi:pyrimidine deaminase RibD-like protein
MATERSHPKIDPLDHRAFME